MEREKAKRNVNFVLLLFFKNRAFTSGKLMHEFSQPRKHSLGHALGLGFLETLSAELARSMFPSAEKNKN